MRLKLKLFAALTVLALSSCTPEQLDTLGITDPAPREVLLALDDVRVPQPDGSVLEIDGTYTSAAAVAERLPLPPPPPPLIPPVSARAHPEPNVQRWFDVALDAGWSPNMWGWLSCVIYRESKGNPNAWNRSDPGTGSRGLVQINSVNLRFLRDRDILWDINELFNGWTNLRAANQMYVELGKGPWRSTSRGC